MRSCHVFFPVMQSYEPSAPSVVDNASGPRSFAGSAAGAAIPEPVQPDVGAGRSYICGGTFVFCGAEGVWHGLVSADGLPPVAQSAKAPHRGGLECGVWPECGQRVVLNAEDPVACRHCLCRILYKTRTTRSTCPVAMPRTGRAGTIVV